MNNLMKTELDRGYIEKCAEYGITDEETISQLMQVTANSVNQERDSSLQKQASYTNSQNGEFQKQANLESLTEPIDVGYVGRCHEYNIVDPNEITAMMKVAQNLVREEMNLPLEKSASLNEQDVYYINRVMDRL